VAAETSSLEGLNVPRVFVQHDDRFCTPSVVQDGAAFQRRAVEYLRAKGRRRVAHLSMEPWREVAEFEGALKDLGLEVRPYWNQGVPTGSVKYTAANTVNLLMQLEGEKRPDAIIIYDDNLIEHAGAGLLAAGVKVPEEIEVVAMCNFPVPVPSVFPVKRLGLDIRQLLAECFRTIDTQRRGETPPPIKKLPPLFEDELSEVAEWR
jgi:DNA-binding LacI/PurR family transcriptional regulator